MNTTLFDSDYLIKYLSGVDEIIKITEPFGYTIDPSNQDYFLSPQNVQFMSIGNSLEYNGLRLALLRFGISFNDINNYLVLISTKCVDVTYSTLSINNNPGQIIILIAYRV
jgi:hypothetical protein